MPQLQHVFTSKPALQCGIPPNHTSKMGLLISVCVDCDFASRSIHLYSAHVSSEDLEILLRRTRLDHPGQSHLRLLFNMEPSLRCNAGLRIGSSDRPEHSSYDPKRLPRSWLHICRARRRAASEDLPKRAKKKKEYGPKASQCLCIPGEFRRRRPFTSRIGRRWDISYKERFGQCEEICAVAGNTTRNC